MFSSSAAATAEAMTGAPRRTQANPFAGSLPANSRGRSEQHRSFWESPRSGAFKAAQKRACKGGREVRIRVSDGPVTDRSGCPCSIMVAAGPASNRVGEFKRAG